MNAIELDRSLRKLRLSRMASTLQTRIVQAQSEKLAPIDFLSTLVEDELTRRQDRLLVRRVKEAGFRNANKSLGGFDFDFNKNMDRRLVFDLGTCRFMLHRATRGRVVPLFLGPPGSGKSHLAHALGFGAIRHRVYYREAHVLLEDLPEASLHGVRKGNLAELAAVPSLVQGLERRNQSPLFGRRLVLCTTCQRTPPIVHCVKHVFEAAGERTGVFRRQVLLDGRGEAGAMLSFKHE